MPFSTGESIQKKRIDRSESKFSSFRCRPRAIYLIQDPRDFRSGKIRVDQESGTRRYPFLVPFDFQPRANFCCTAILPDNGTMYRLARFALPNDGRLALIGDANGGDIGGT